MSHRTHIALLALGLALASVFASLVATSRQLPARVASHFNGAGVPDGWMMRGTYLWTMALVAIGMSVFVVGVFYAIRFFPHSTINLPHREYWLGPERRQQTFDFIFRAGVWLGAVQAALLMAVHLLVVAANDSQPVAMSPSIWLLLAAFLLAIMVWTYRLLKRFRRPGGAPAQ